MSPVVRPARQHRLHPHAPYSKRYGLGLAIVVVGALALAAVVIYVLHLAMKGM